MGEEPGTCGVSDLALMGAEPGTLGAPDLAQMGEEPGTGGAPSSAQMMAFPLCAVCSTLTCEPQCAFYSFTRVTLSR